MKSEKYIYNFVIFKNKDDRVTLSETKNVVCSKYNMRNNIVKRV
jgi:hypothetical protein